MYDIILGRNKTDLKKFNNKATIFLGKHYVEMERTHSLANPVHLDINKPHIVLISGKRGSGKSYSMGVIAEGLSNLKSELKQNVSTLIFDTMGIFWTMKNANYREEKLLQKWDLKPKKSKIKIFVPEGIYEKYQKQRIPVDFKFSINPLELDPEEWCSLFNIKLNSNLGIIIERATLKSKKRKSTDIKKIINSVKKDPRASEEDKNLISARLESIEKWGIFSSEGTKINHIIKGGRTSIIDLSAYSLIENGQKIKELIVGFLSKKILEKRLLQRKIEEVSEIHKSSVFKKQEKAPLIWMMIDEAHEFLPKKNETLASPALIRLLREGRQPGVSMVLATQQPGKIHSDVMTQSDLVISHRLTAKPDINALNEIMQSYLTLDLKKHLDSLPRVKGAAIALDDNAEKIYPLRVRPRLSWHGGEDPSIIRKKAKESLFSN